MNLGDLMLSIIIPVYNGESFIRECLENIFAQTLKEIEVILIDDGSEDNSVAVIKEYAKENLNIKLFEQEHQGSGAARNLGMNQAIGKYIAFCDVDDYYMNHESLELMVKACEENKVSICGALRKDLVYGILNDNLYLKDVCGKNPKGRKVSFRELQCDYGYQNYIFEKKLLLENNIYFPDYLRYQDPPFFVKAMIAAEQFWVLPIYFYCYRMGHQDKVSISKKIKYVLMGIYDNLQLAIENNYERLYCLLINYRINEEYYDSIYDNREDEEVKYQLKKIKELNDRAKYSQRILISDKYQQLDYIFHEKTAYKKYFGNGKAAFDIFRKLALLYSRGYSISDILQVMGIRNIYIYGVGDIGQMVLASLTKDIDISGVYDSNYNREICIDSIKYAGKNSYSVRNPADIPEDDVPILITPGEAFYDISYDMIARGIKRKRILSLFSVLEIGIKYLIHTEEQMTALSQHQFLITGAQFENKGAQSMLFVAVDEIRKRYPNAIIWYYPLDDGRNYNSEIVKKYNLLILRDEGIIKYQIMNIVMALDAIVDVSGYALSSYWEHEWYMLTLRIAKLYHIPLYIMPQSFGPFEFVESKDRELRSLLASARIIYAREQEGYNMLVDHFRLKNVYLARDIVLQNKTLDICNLYSAGYEIKVQNLDTKSNVAIIPNVRNYEFGLKIQILEMYKAIIEKLLFLNKNIYIVNHSNDMEVCEDIYEMFKDKKNVYIVSKEMDCFEFRLFVKNFEFVIASRFHAIVHAYKEMIPCLSIGWAEKYKKLLESFGMEKYCFDIQEGIALDQILDAVVYLNDHYEIEKKNIELMLSLSQSENCFDILSELKDGC